MDHGRLRRQRAGRKAQDAAGFELRPDRGEAEEKINQNMRRSETVIMKDIKTNCKIALVQAEPVMFDKSASLKKALQYIREAASQKPNLIVFPELFIPGYPVGMNFGFSMGKRSEEGRKDWKRYYDASVVAGETEFQRLAEAARKAVPLPSAS